MNATNFLIADVFADTLNTIRSEIFVIVPVAMVLEVMYIGWCFNRKRHGEDINIGSKIFGCILILGATGIVAKYLPSLGS